MKIIIDDKKCTKHKMTITEVLAVLALKNGFKKSTIQNMCDRGIFIIDEDVNFYKVSKEWSEEVNKILKESGTVKEEDRLIELATKMREAYPKGKMLNKRNGQPTIYSFRGSTQMIAERMKTFFSRYGNYSDEDIIDATKRYVASFNGNYQDWGFRTLKYFIFKDDSKEGPNGNYVDSISPLLDFLENKDDEDTIVGDDWTSKGVM